MIWNRLRNWLGSTHEDAARAEALSVLLSELGYPPQDTLDDYSTRLLRSNAREPFKRLADRGWLLRFNPNRDCETDRVNARLVHLVCERVRVEVGQVREIWLNGSLLGMKIRQRGSRTFVARYLNEAANGTPPRGVDVAFVLSVAQRLAYHSQSEFTFVNMAAPSDAAIVTAIPVAALPQIRKLRLLPVVTPQYWAPVFHVAYSDQLLATIGLTMSDGPVTVTNPADLRAITQLGCLVGELRLSNSALLTSIKPLRNLTGAGALTIERCSTLKTLKGLENLSLLGGPLRISNNPVLRDLTPLANVRTVFGNLVIDRNAELTSLDGLHNCREVTGNLIIENNDSLPDLAALERLTAVGGNLVICGNRRLRTLAGLSQLVNVAGDVTISNNQALDLDSAGVLRKRLASSGFSGVFDADEPDLML